MATPFLSSEEYDERAHQFYNEGRYDDAVETLREGLDVYPNSVELHIGLGYAFHAREEFALAGFGETLLKFGQRPAALRSFRRILELGYSDDLELMLQVGRALFREGLIEDAKQFFEVAVEQASESAEAVACVGYAQHRLGDTDGAVTTLRRALQLDSDHSEARIYLGNILYDRGDYEAALYHLDRSSPDDHWDELGIWRIIELKKTVYRLRDNDGELKPWQERLKDLAGEPDDIDEMLAEIEARVVESDQEQARGQLELFGALLTSLAGREDPDLHTIALDERRELEGTWDEIVHQMHRASGMGRTRTLEEYMATEARRAFTLTGTTVSTLDAESFVRAIAHAGLVRIVK